MRGKGVIDVAGHSQLNLRCTTLPGCSSLRNDLCCDGIIKLYSLIHLARGGRVMSAISGQLIADEA